MIHEYSKKLLQNLIVVINFGSNRDPIGAGDIRRESLYPAVESKRLLKMMIMYFGNDFFAL